MKNLKIYVFRFFAVGPVWRIDHPGHFFKTSPFGPLIVTENTLLPSRQWVAQEIHGS